MVDSSSSFTTSLHSIKIPLISLLRECIQHLETQDDASSYSPLIVQTSIKLQEYADAQAKALQTKVWQLQKQQEEIVRQHQHALQQLQPPAASVPPPAVQQRNTAPVLSALEQEKRAAAEKHRQHVLEQRRKGALEQKRKEEEAKRKFLQMEQRKEMLKRQAALKAEAAQHKAKATLSQEKKIQQEALFELGKRSKTSVKGEEQAEQKAESSEPPKAAHQPFKTQQQTTQQEPAVPFQPSPPPPPQQQQPTGRDRKYSTLSSHHPTTTPLATDTFELKRQILIHWALQPPEYQRLKRIDHLVSTIQTVYPPFGGVPAHAYFDGWNCIDCVAHNSDALKKAVRQVRVFLHPDKLPRDFTETHVFLCKLLWDVTNDALEDFNNTAQQQ